MHIPKFTLKNVQFILQLTRVDEIEDLKENKNVEN